MARPRKGQRGHVRLLPSGAWQGDWFEYREDPDTGREFRKHRTRELGTVAELTRAEAEARLALLIASVGYESEAAGESVRKASRATGRETCGWFIRERYWPLKESTWRRKTRDLNRYLFDSIIVPHWASVRLSALDKVAAQVWLGKLAERYSRSLVHKCRVYLRAICEEAIDQGYLDRNPFRKLAMPVDTRRVDKTTLDAAEVAAVLGELRGTRDRLIFRLFVVAGLRRQEVFALRWDDVLARQLRIDETVEMSKVVDATKTKGSRALVGISQAIARDLAVWRKETDRSRARDFVFASKAGTHLAPENWIRSTLKPAAERAGVNRINYQMLRRTFATLAPGAGISLKHVSTQLRHATIITTADEYMQPVEAVLLDGLDALEAAIRAAGH